MGQKVQGLVQFVGTANVRDFDYYKLEMGPGDAPRNWSFLFSRQSAVVNGPLGAWNSDTVPPGMYTIRLIVVDRTGNYPEPCRVTVIVER
jgi:hypothetical protein